MGVAFANQIFMGKVETEILSQSAFKPLVWKRHIDDIFSLWDTNREVLTQFIDQAITIILLSSSPLKFLIQKLLFWTPVFTKAKDSYMNQCSLTYAPTTSPLKHVSTHISPRVTHQELRRFHQRSGLKAANNKFL